MAISNSAEHLTGGLSEGAHGAHCRHLARIHKHMHTYPWIVPLLVSQVALRFDLDTVG